MYAFMQAHNSTYTPSLILIHKENNSNMMAKHTYEMRQQRDGHDGLAEAHFVRQNAVQIALVHRHLHTDTQKKVSKKSQ